jgi:SAM-dependent methyltransferase
MLSSSGSALLTQDRPSPIVLRLLPFVHRPPARVLVTGGPHEAKALSARGYDVTLVSTSTGDLDAPDGTRIPMLAADFGATDFAGAYDLVCARDGLDADGLRAAARALRPGGQLFGAFTGHPSALLHAVAPDFDAPRLEPSGFDASVLEAVLVRR